MSFNFTDTLLMFNAIVAIGGGVDSMERSWVSGAGARAE
jgi:hypothetical protein